MLAEMWWDGVVRIRNGAGRLLSTVVPDSQSAFLKRSYSSFPDMQGTSGSRFASGCVSFRITGVHWRKGSRVENKHAHQQAWGRFAEILNKVGVSAIQFSPHRDIYAPPIQAGGLSVGGSASLVGSVLF